MELNPIQWAIRPLKNYAKFSGRASRAEFWWFFLFFTLGYFALLMIGFAISGSGPVVEAGESPFGMYTRLGAFLAVIGLYWLALLVPTMALTIRRLHDTNHSGWWLGGYVLLYIVYLGFMMSLGSGANTDLNVGFAMLMLVWSLAFLAYAVTLFVFYCLPGTRGPNRYGNDPYGEDVAEVFA